MNVSSPCNFTVMPKPCWQTKACLLGARQNFENKKEPPQKTQNSI